MQIKLKRSIKMLGKDIEIKFVYKNLKIRSDKMGFVNFDIGDEEELIDSILNDIDKETKPSPTKPLYIALSDLFFSNISNLDSIEYEDNDHTSEINRNDL